MYSINKLCIYIFLRYILYTYIFVSVCALSLLIQGILYIGNRFPAVVLLGRQLSQRLSDNVSLRNGGPNRGPALDPSVPYCRDVKRGGGGGRIREAFDRVRLSCRCKPEGFMLNDKSLM